MRSFHSRSILCSRICNQTRTQRPALTHEEYPSRFLRRLALVCACGPRLRALSRGSCPQHRILCALAPRSSILALWVGSNRYRRQCNRAPVDEDVDWSFRRIGSVLAGVADHLLYCGLYTWRHVQSAQGVPGRVVLATGLSALIGGQVIASLWHHGHFLRVAVYFWIAATAGALLSRVAICLFHLYVRPHLRRDRNAVIVGGGPRAARIRDELRVHPEWDYKVLGFVDSAAREIPGVSEPLLGRIGDLEEILMKQVVDEVIITLPAKSQYAAIERAISICERVGVQVQYCEDLFETSRLGRCYRERYDNRKLILKMVHDDYRHRIKRALDVLGSTFGLIVCAPLFLVVAILIKCYKQRAGLLCAGALRPRQAHLPHITSSAP